MADTYYGGHDTLTNIIKQSGIFDRDTEENFDGAETILQRIDVEVDITGKRHAKLKKQQAFVNNNLHFIFAIDDDLHDYQKWCFENDLIFMVKEIILLEDDYQALVFKNVEDAMAFKLKWL